MNRRKWSIAEDIELKVMYFKTDKPVLVKYFERSWDAIKLHAARLGLRRWSGFPRQSDLSRLLTDTDETLYWIGFLLADGHFSGNSRLVIALAEIDFEHLKKFASFIGVSKINRGSNGPYQYVSVKAQDKDLIPLITEQFKIHHRKTYHPPDVSGYTLVQNRIFSLIIGFMDGDGSITKRTRYGFMGRIKCHASWLNNLTFMKDTICERFGIESRQEPRIGTSGYAEWNIPATILRAMKKDAEFLNLPILERKWCIVTPHRPNVISAEILDYIRQSTTRTATLAKELGLKYSTIYQTRLRHGWPTVT